MDISQFKQKYKEEALGLIDSLDNILLILEKEPSSTDHIEQVFRIMHTIKGTSGMYGFDLITDVTHHLESLYDLVRDKKYAVNEQVIELTFAAIDVIRDILNQKDGDENERYKDSCQLIITKIDQLILKSGLTFQQRKLPKVASNKEIKKRSYHIIFAPDESFIKRSLNILYTMQDLFQLGTYQISSDITNEEKEQWNIILVTDKSREDIEDTLIFVMDYCRITLIADFDVLSMQELDERDNYVKKLNEVENPEEESEHEISDEKSVEIRAEAALHIKQATKKILVDAEKLDTLIYLVSELVTSKSELYLSFESQNRDKTFGAMEKIDKLSKLFRENALSIRLISLQDLLNRFRRLVRDLAKQLGKMVDYEVIGDETELDKNIIEAIAEPIMHLIRNCLDHGIEMPEERKAAGKNETGIIKFVAFKKGSFVFIQISDDGRGIDKQKIMKKAIAKNIISENAQLSDKEIYDLIFVPGFSTAESLTQVSGRGVGMDIVRNKIHEIRGDISIDSELGLGTSFTLKLQQTIAIIDTLLIRCDNSKFAIPLEDVEACEIVLNETLEKSTSKQINFNNELIPYINLHNEFNLNGKKIEKWRSIIINKQDKRYAILTDEIIGEYQAVIKPLDKTFSDQKFLSGASILGDGTIALLLDTEKLKALIL